MRHIVQYVIVAIIIVQALYWLWKTIFRPSSVKEPDCQKGCTGCIIQHTCHKPQAMMTRKNSRK